MGFLDSGGLRVLVELRASAATLHTRFTLVAAGDRVRHTLESAHLDDLLARPERRDLRPCLAPRR